MESYFVHRNMYFILFSIILTNSEIPVLLLLCDVYLNIVNIISISYIYI